MNAEEIITNYIGGSNTQNMLPDEAAFDKEILDIEYYGGYISEVGCNETINFEPINFEPINEPIEGGDFEPINFEPIEGGDFEPINEQIEPIEPIEGGDFEPINEPIKKVKEVVDLVDVIESLMF